MENNIDKLSRVLAKLPGLGSRSAKRIVLHLLKNQEQIMLPLSDLLVKTAESIHTCSTCGNLDSSNPCHICTDSKRDTSLICVIEDVNDLWAMERSKVFTGTYHVLGGVLSALDGIGPDQLTIHSLVERVKNNNIQEVILANNATIEGQTTAHYISECLKEHNIKITRLAHGIPIGGELDYLDDGTLHAALHARKVL